MTESSYLKISSIKDEKAELHPLLRKLLMKLPDTERLEYTHGVTEMGADFVFSKRNTTLNLEEYVGVIAKIGKIAQDFSDTERQIDECSVPRTFLGGKIKIRLDEIWVIATSNISKNAQEKIHEKYATRKIHFIDGIALAKLVDTNLPAYWRDIPLEIGDYLTNLRHVNEQRDLALSLIPSGDKSIYIEQDIYDCPDIDLSERPFQHTKQVRVAILNEIAKQRLILIQGAMGSGKSKLVRWIIRHLTNPDTYLKEALLPISVSFKELADDFAGDIGKMIECRLGDTIKDDSHKASNILVIIDALDEKALSAEEQISKITDISDFVSKNSRVKVVLTSRYLDCLEQSIELPIPIARYEIRHLSLERTIEFLQTICSQLNLKSRIVEDLKKSQLFRDLPKSPISAILLAKLLSDNTHDLPSNLTELYTKYFELTLGRWDIDKGLQSQKEYQALERILCDSAAHIIDNELLGITPEGLKELIASYLTIRNLEIDPNTLYRRMLDRCEILTLDKKSNVISFKHRTFAEFLYSKGRLSSRSLGIDSKALQLYWMNVYFFYIGLLKDCPEELRAIINLSPQNEQEQWLKVVNLSNYLLAGYATPYVVISEGIAAALKGAADLYRNVLQGNSSSPFVHLPRMVLLYLMQLIIKDSYSYDFFCKALEDSALSIETDESDEVRKLYALFFANVAHLYLDESDCFGWLLDRHSANLPLDLTLAIQHESKPIMKRNVILQKQDKRVRRMIKGNASVTAEIEKLYKRSIASLPVHKARSRERCK